MKKRLLLGLALMALLLVGCGPGYEHPYPLNEERIKADTEYLCNEIGPRPVGTAKEVEACDWLEQQLEGIGFSQEAGNLERTYFEGFPNVYSENLIATCNPDSTGPIFCIMAHYDTVETTPGARDNTASVATLLELARYIGPSWTKQDIQIRFLFLGSEENGYHGATAYVKSLTEEEIQRHIAGYNMENSAAKPTRDAVLMTGTQGGRTAEGYLEGNFLEAAENAASRSFSWAYGQYYGGETILTHFGGSDHVSFHKGGIDAANVSWRYVREDGRPTIPPEYHKPTDTPEGLDYEGAVITGCCILGGIEHLAVSEHG